MSQRRLAEAESLYRTVIALDSVHGADNASRGRYLRGLGSVLYQQGRLPEAEQYFTRALDIQRRVRSDHPDVGGTLNNLGGPDYAQHEYQRALESYEQARPVMEKSLGPKASERGVPRQQHGRDAVEAEAVRTGGADAASGARRQGRSDAGKRRIDLDHASGTGRRAPGSVPLPGGEPIYRRALAMREKTANTNPRPAQETLRDSASSCGGQAGLPRPTG